MQLDWASLLELLPALTSIVGGGLQIFTLSSARDYFDQAGELSQDVRISLDELQIAQREKLIRLLNDELDDQTSDYEAGRELSVDELKLKDRRRERSCEDLVSFLWEDALLARKLEQDYASWRMLELVGRRFCEAPKFVNPILWSMFLIDLISAPFSLTSVQWWVIGGSLVGLPILIASIIWFKSMRMEKGILLRITTPRRGVALSREFGNE